MGFSAVCEGNFQLFRVSVLPVSLAEELHDQLGDVSFKVVRVLGLRCKCLLTRLLLHWAGKGSLHIGAQPKP